MLDKAKGGVMGRNEGGDNHVVRRTEGMDVSRDALLPPIVKLIQPTSKDVEMYGVGKFLRTDTGEVFEVLEAVPLVSRVTQTKWAGSFNRDALPECWSSNTPFGMRLRGTGNRIVGLITAPSIAQRAVVNLYAEKTTGEAGVWYQLKAKTMRLLDEADRDLAMTTMRSYLEANLGVMAADDEDGESRKEEGLGASSALADKLVGHFKGVSSGPEDLPF